jgi:hypothetical protein
MDDIVEFSGAETSDMVMMLLLFSKECSRESLQIIQKCGRYTSVILYQVNFDFLRRRCSPDASKSSEQASTRFLPPRLASHAVLQRLPPKRCSEF